MNCLFPFSCLKAFLVYSVVFYLNLLLILKSPLADDDVLDSSPVSKPLLKHCVVLEKLLGLLFGDFVQGVLIDHPNTLKLNTHRQTCNVWKWVTESH